VKALDYCVTCRRFVEGGNGAAYGRFVRDVLCYCDTEDKARTICTALQDAETNAAGDDHFDVRRTADLDRADPRRTRADQPRTAS
jgi:hypothetical protein